VLSSYCSSSLLILKVLEDDSFYCVVASAKGRAIRLCGCAGVSVGKERMSGERALGTVASH
jgi:hypothetical protein